MSNVNCEACSYLIEHGVQDITKEILENVRCGRGLVIPQEGEENTSNYGDIRYLVDCLVGKISSRINGYNECDWKQFAKLLSDNLTNVLEAMAYNETGLWDNVNFLWNALNKSALATGGTPLEFTLIDNTFTPLAGATRNPLILQVNRVEITGGGTCGGESAESGLIRLFMDPCNYNRGGASIIGRRLGYVSRETLHAKGLTWAQIHQVDQYRFQQTVGAISYTQNSVDMGATVNLAVRGFNPEIDSGVVPENTWVIYVQSVSGTMPSSGAFSTIQTPYIYIPNVDPN